LLSAFHYRGLASIEFKFNASDGKFYLIELNPRTVSGNELGIRAGVDLAWIAYCDMAGVVRDATPVPGAQLGVKYVHEEWDVQSFAELHKRGELTFAEWIRSLWGTRAWGLFAWDDPLPLLVGLWRFVWVGVLGRG
jgi:predicted ATP-grasp superfamily ATP-dependent carboligase